MKLIRLIISTIFSFFICTCYAQTPGGWNRNNAPLDNANYINIALYQHDPEAKLLSYSDVSTQIVAGVNYSMSIKYITSNKINCANIIFYRDLSENISLTKWMPIECSKY